MMVGMSLQTIYMIVDMIFVGRVSSEALTALAFNMPILFFGIGVTFGLGTGVTAVIARFIGEEDKASADNAAEHAVILGLVIAALFTFAGLMWGIPLLQALGVPGRLTDMAWSYFRILAAGFIFMVMSVFSRSILSGEGDMKTPMMIQGSGTVLNIVLDPIFIFSLGMGVAGAALATVVSQAIVGLVFVYLLFVKDRAYVSFGLQDFRFSGSILSNIVGIGAPASFSFLIMSIGGAVFNRIVVDLSADAVAALQVGMRLNHVFVLPIMSIGTALVTLVAMFLGASRHDLVRGIVDYGMSRAVIIAVLMATLFYAFAPAMVAVFSDQASIRSHGTTYMRMIVFSYPFVAVTMLSGRILQGMGHGLPLLVISSLRVLLISAPLAWLAVYRWHKPVEWVWGAMVVGVVAAAAVAWVWLRRSLRQMKNGDRVRTPITVEEF